MITLKFYQDAVVQNVLEIFRYVAEQLRQVSKPVERAAVVSHNGGILIKAPTGAGKTLIAGEIVNTFSREEKVVWLWFAPFKGLVGQSEASLRDAYPCLRVRNLKEDRQAAGTKAGDIWVSTWQSVATHDADARKIRADSEDNTSLDTLVIRLRREGFSIGVVVDEAHHGFGHGTQALNFYSQVLRPEFTLLLTATPDDADAEAFKRAAGFQRLHPISVSREDAVDAGLVKPGVRSIAFVAATPDQATRVNFEATALREGTQMHRLIKASLAAEGISLVPLMLVQVDSSADSVERARETLKTLGFSDSQIATHTAAEPDANLQALAVDENKEVLIFKMAVALRFDAPRAFTLVSMRGIADADFGTQIVGRIMRIHRRCQGRELPLLLRNAYVFLADCEVQEGLSTAAQKLNQIKTELAKVSPFTVIVRVAGESQLQIVRNGQGLLLPSDRELPFEAAVGGEALEPNRVRSFSEHEVLELFELESLPASPESALRPGQTPTGAFEYLLREGCPTGFLTQRMKIGVDEDGWAGGIAEAINFSDSVLEDGRRQAVSVMRVEQSVFQGAEVSRTKIQAELEKRETEMKAQRMLFNMGTVSPQDLNKHLLSRLRAEYQRRKDDIADHEEELEFALCVILVQHHKLLHEARKACAAKYTEVVSAEPLPVKLYSAEPLAISPKNIYGVYPSGLNKWERAFTRWLDNTEDGVLHWWHRNLPHKPWSVAVTLPSGEQFFPDFLLSIDGRKTPDAVLLADTKWAINDAKNSKSKVITEHQSYGKTAILYYEQEIRWKLVRYNEAQDKNVVAELFDLTEARTF